MYPGLASKPVMPGSFQGEPGPTGQRMPEMLSSTRRRFKPLGCRALFLVWVILSLAWAAGVGYHIYHKVSVQTDMARDVERDLDAGNCAGKSCMPANVQAKQSWLNVASTYIRFGSMDMATSVVGPPVGILLIGFGAIFVRRRWNGPAIKPRSDYPPAD